MIHESGVADTTLVRVRDVTERRRVHEPGRHHLGRVTLLPEDVAELDGVLERAGRRATYAAGRWEYDTLEDLRKHTREPLVTVRIEAHTMAPDECGDVGFAVIDTTPRGVSVWISNSDSLELLGVLGAIRELVRRRQNVLQRLSHLERMLVIQTMVAGIATATAYALLLVAGSPIDLSRPRSLEVGSLLLLIGLVGLGSAVSEVDEMTGRLTGRMRLYLHEGTRDGWLRRNADALILLIVGAVVGALISRVFG